MKRRSQEHRIWERELCTRSLESLEPIPYMRATIKPFVRALLDWRLDADGIQTYPASDVSSKWISQSCKCPYCGHTWEAIAPLGSTGIECPACYECDLDFEWRER